MRDRRFTTFAAVKSFLLRYKVVGDSQRIFEHIFSNLLKFDKCRTLFAPCIRNGEEDGLVIIAEDRLLYEWQPQHRSILMVPVGGKYLVLHPKGCFLEMRCFLCAGEGKGKRSECLKINHAAKIHILTGGKRWVRKSFINQRTKFTHHGEMMNAE
jgi:hypothetical protein